MSLDKIVILISMFCLGGLAAYFHFSAQKNTLTKLLKKEVQFNYLLVFYVLSYLLLVAGFFCLFLFIRPYFWSVLIGFVLIKLICYIQDIQALAKKQ